MNKLVRLPVVMDMTALSRSMVYCKLDPKDKRYDPSFPKPVRIASNAVAWVADEVQTWIDERIASRASCTNGGRKGKEV